MDATAIRKTFTDPLNLSESKVSHAELIEKATGQVLCDLTDADIGVGGDREGSVLWSPDSKRFAYVVVQTKQRFIRVQANRLRKLICRSTSRPAKKAIHKLEARLWARNP